MSSRRRCRVSSMVVAPSPEAERPRERAAAAPALLPPNGCRQRRSDQRRREWRSGQRPMQRPLRRVHLLATRPPAVPNLSSGGRGTKPPGRYSALKPPICTRQHPRQTSSRALDRPCCIICLSDTVVTPIHPLFCWLVQSAVPQQHALSCSLPASAGRAPPARAACESESTAQQRDRREAQRITGLAPLTAAEGRRPQLLV